MPFAIVEPGNDALNHTALTAVLFYLLAYGVMNIGAFAAVTVLARRHPARQLSDFAGLGRRSPGTAFALSLFLLSLGGVPPLVGLFAKLYIFFAAMTAGTPAAYVLAAAVVVNSVIAMFYYLAVVRTMWFEQPVLTEPLRPGFALAFTMAALAVVAVATGVYPQAFGVFADLATLGAALP
jgi:NADH-quinone oxidoreductase subunit N